MDNKLKNDMCCLTCKRSLSEEGTEEDGDLLYCEFKEEYVAEDELCGAYNN